MQFLSPRGWATFAWQSDYGQFYLFDDQREFTAPIEITPEMEKRSFAVTPAGLVVYTASCLQQQIRIQIYDAEPDHSPIEEMSGNPWTRVETTPVELSVAEVHHLQPIDALAAARGATISP